MNLPCLTLLVLLASSTVALGQPAPFNRHTEELSQILETDVATVMARGMTHDFAARLCERLGGQVAAALGAEASEWRKRNDAFFRGASAALNEIGDRHLAVGGEQAKQGYLQAVLVTTTRSTNQQLMRQLNGATLDNNIVPPEGPCVGLTRMLRDGVGDFRNTPEVTRALVPYMQRKGIQ